MAQRLEFLEIRSKSIPSTNDISVSSTFNDLTNNFNLLINSNFDLDTFKNNISGDNIFVKN